MLDDGIAVLATELLSQRVQPVVHRLLHILFWGCGKGHTRPYLPGASISEPGNALLVKGRGLRKMGEHLLQVGWEHTET